MERRVSVNAEMGSTVTPDGVPVGWSQDEWRPTDASEEAPGDALQHKPPTAGRQVAKDQDFGPCLYLGPSGQRCARRALAGGFCRAHTSGAPKKSESHELAPRNPIRFWAAAGAIVALLWPYLDLVVREIIRWMRSH